MNRVLRQAAAGLVYGILLSPAAVSADASAISWSWPWNRQSQRQTRTIIHPEPQLLMQRDQRRAQDLIRGDWLREKFQIEQKHRRALQEYVDTRLALAVERARIEQLRAQQLAEERRRTFWLSASDQNATSVAEPEPQRSFGILSGQWPPRETNQSAGSSSRSSFTGQIVDGAKDLTRRTKDVLGGNDELVLANQAHGLPHGVAVFLALLMLHIPSVALASGFIGFLLIRNHRTTLGTMFLGLASLLTIVIFFVLPW